MAKMLQVVFFHTVGERESIESLLTKRRERVANGSRIIATLRFFDKDNLIIGPVLKGIEVQEKIKDAASFAASNSLLTLIIKNFRLFWLIRKADRLKKHACSLISKRIAVAMMEPYGVSVKESNGSFHFVWNNEKPRLIEAVSNSSWMKFFLLKSDSLLSNKSETLASVMYK